MRVRPLSRQTFFPTIPIFLFAGIKNNRVDKVKASRSCGIEKSNIVWYTKLRKNNKNAEVNMTETEYGNKVRHHADICKELNEIYAQKNHDYGDSFGKGYTEYGMVMAVIRLEDKLNRLKSLIKAESLVKDESINDTLMDLANYAIMTVIERERTITNE